MKKRLLKPGKPRDNTENLKRISDEINEGNPFFKFSMNVPKALHREFRKICFLKEIDMRQVLLEAISEFVKKNKKL